MTIVFLGLAALVSSVISGVAGMAGGITLLAAMTLVMPFSQIVPLHGIAQLVSNLSRTLFLLKNVHRKILLAFLMGTPLGGVLGYLLLSRIQRPEWFLGLIAALLLYVVFRPKSIPELRLPAWAFVFLGFFAAMMGCLVGATGPLLAPFFVRSDLEKESIVATKAACQIFIHLVKLPVFLALSFPYQEHFGSLAIMILAVVIGTRIGTQLLKGISTNYFMLIVKCMMCFIAFRLIYKLVI